MSSPDYLKYNNGKKILVLVGLYFFISIIVFGISWNLNECVREVKWNSFIDPCRFRGADAFFSGLFWPFYLSRVGFSWLI